MKEIQSEANILEATGDRPWQPEGAWRWLSERDGRFEAFSSPELCFTEFHESVNDVAKHQRHSLKQDSIGTLHKPDQL